MNHDEAPTGQSNDGERKSAVPEMDTMRELPKAERMRIIRDRRWIPYPRANLALTQLRYVLEQPSSNRMTGLTMAGPTNNGKTTIVKEFIRTHGNQGADPSAERAEFLYIETPPVPNVSMLFTQILRGVGDLKAEKGTMMQKFARVLHILPQMRPRMLFLDEIHNVLAGSAKQSEAFLNTLKHLSNQLHIPVVLIGTDAALNVLRTDQQVLNRYPAFTLLPWSADAQFARLVSTILKTFPLRGQSKLSSAVVARLHERTGGALGSVLLILQRAAVYAIENGIEEVNAATLEATEFG